MGMMISSMIPAMQICILPDSEFDQFYGSNNEGKLEGFVKDDLLGCPWAVKKNDLDFSQTVLFQDRTNNFERNSSDCTPEIKTKQKS